jgi:hypothetical protein
MKANLTQEQIKEILDNAPNTATHYGIYSCDNIEYFKLTGIAWLRYIDENWSLSCFNHHKWCVNLSDLRSQLELEWENGLPPVGVECEVRFRTDGEWTDWFDKAKLKAGYDSKLWFSHSFGDVVLPAHDVEFRPTETPEQKAAREREEAAIHIHDVANEAFFAEKTMDMPDDAGWEFADEDVRRMWFAVVDLTGYRKESN